MKRILCLIDSLGPGGAQRQMVGLASFLKEKGYDVTVACYHDNRFYGDLLSSNNVPYVYLEKANNKSLRIWHIARYIRHGKPDVVISYLETPSICACIAKLFNHKFKLIVSERNTSPQTGIKEKTRFNLFKVADYVVPNSHSQELYIQKTFPKLMDKTVTIPNFVDLEHFVPPLNRRRRDVPEIMIAASIWPSKNALGFIDAVAQLKTNGVRIHISWYGYNTDHLDYINHCENKIKQNNLEDYIELKEKSSQILDLYQDADYFCLPSFYEGTPNVICEAMACGLPIVCSNVCDNSRYVTEGENGFLFNPLNTDSIVAAFGKLFALNDEEYYAFCYRSRMAAEKKLSKGSFVDKYINLIEQ